MLPINSFASALTQLRGTSASQSLVANQRLVSQTARRKTTSSPELDLLLGSNQNGFSTIRTLGEYLPLSRESLRYKLVMSRDYRTGTALGDSARGYLWRCSDPYDSAADVALGYSRGTIHRYTTDCTHLRPKPRCPIHDITGLDSGR